VTAVAQKYCLPLPQEIVAPPVRFGQPMLIAFAFREPVSVLTETLAGYSGIRGQASVEYTSGMAFKELAATMRDPRMPQAYADILP
jgi:hypothetical protein